MTTATAQAGDDREGNRPPGLSCRKCACTDLRVIETRKRQFGAITRIRQCRHCGTRMTTRERP